MLYASCLAPISSGTCTTALQLEYSFPSLLALPLVLEVVFHGGFYILYIEKSVLYIYEKFQAFYVRGNTKVLVVAAFEGLGMVAYDILGTFSFSPRF